MPSSSKKQHNFMAAVAHSPSFTKKVGVPQSVGKEFTEADKGKKMNPRARFGGGKVKGYSGKDGSDVEADDIEAKRAARAERIRSYNETPKAKAAKRTAEDMVRKLNISGPDDEAKSEPSVLPKSKDSSENEAQLPEDIAAEAARMKRAASEERSKQRQQREAPMREAAAQGLRFAPETEAYMKKGYKKGGSVKKNWIKDAIKKPGALRQSLKVKEGEKIPAKKLASAAKKPGKMGQRARLAQTLKGFSKGGGIESRGKTRCKMV